MNKEILVNAGFTNRESEAYLALLQLQENLASEIAKKTKENRTHLYDTLNSLIRKGLASYVIKNGKKYFKPAPPEKICEYIDEKKKLVEKSLPELQELFKPRVQAPTIEVFEGKEGIKTVLFDVLRENKEWMCMGSTGKSPEIIPFVLEHFHKKRIKQKILLKAIFNDDEFGRERGKTVSKQQFAQVKYLQKTSPATIYIYGNKVTTILWQKEKLIAIMIKDKDIAQTYKEYFDALWQIAK